MIACPRCGALNEYWNISCDECGYMFSNLDRFANPGEDSKAYQERLEREEDEDWDY